MAKKRRDKRRKYLEAELTGEVLTNDETGERFEMALVPRDQAAVWRADSQPKGKRGNLIRRIMAKVRPLYRDSTSEASAQPSTDTPMAAGSRWGLAGLSSYVDEKLKAEDNRKAIYKDYDRLYKESPYAHRALKVMVGSVFSSIDGDQDSYELKSDDTTAQRILEEFDDRVAMQEFMPKRLKAAMKKGDQFTERVVDSSGQSIVRLKHLPPERMERNTDDYGRLDAERAFIMRSESDVIAEFAYWQVNHFRYNHDLESEYGEGFYFPARFPWRRFELMDKGVIVRRLTKASKRYAFYIPMPAGTPEDEQAKIIEQVKRDVRRGSMADSDGNLDTRRRPMLEEQDVFIPLLGGENIPPARVELLDAGGFNDTLDDVKMKREELIMALVVPPAHMGIDKEVRGRAHLGWVDIQFARELRSTQKQAAKVQRSDYDLQLFLAGVGVPPKGYDDLYKVVYPAISFVDERMKAEVEQLKWRVASEARLELGLPTRWVLTNIVGLSEEEVEEIEGDEDYEPVGPGSKQPTMPEPPSDKQGRFAKEAFFQNQKVLNEIQDLRDRLRYVARHGLNKPLEV